MEYDEKLLHTENLFSGKVLRLDLDRVLLPNGKESLREIVYLSGAVCLLAFDDKERVLVVEQFRSPYREALLEIPAGKIDPGETPDDAAVRELMEETGYRPGRLEPLGVIYPSPGCVHETIYLYKAFELIPESAAPDEDEFIRSRFMPVDELAELILKGAVPDAKTQVAVMRYLYEKKTAIE